MTYDKLVAKIKRAYAKTDASKIGEHVAVQVNVNGEAHGAFYIEITEGAVNVQPYEYYDNDMVLTVGEKEIADIATGKIKVGEALSSNKISASGPQIDRAVSLLDSVVFVKAERKNAAKKTTKKTTAKKTTKKASETKAESKKAATPKKEAAPKKEVAPKKETASKKEVAPKKETASKKEAEPKAEAKVAEKKAVTAKKATKKTTK